MGGTRGPEPSQAALVANPSEESGTRDWTCRTGGGGSILASLRVFGDSLLLRSRSLSHAETTSGTPQACQTGWRAGFPRRASRPPSAGTDGVILTPRSPPLPTSPFPPFTLPFPALPLLFFFP